MDGMLSSTWLAHNWFAWVQTVALAGALFLIAAAIFLDARARRVSNLIQLTEQHRTLWERMYSQPDLARILETNPDLVESPVTPEEETFVIFIIFHLNNTYYGIKSGFFRKLRGLRKDIERFFSLPIPHAVWKKVRDLQDESFVKFVESCFQ
jgi:hypothetical protein